jgi:hypothetical protein
MLTIKPARRTYRAVRSLARGDERPLNANERAELDRLLGLRWAKLVENGDEQTVVKLTRAGRRAAGA